MSEQGITVITNLHTLDTARAYCERIVGMAQGRVVFDGTPDELTTRRRRQLYGAEGLEGGFLEDDHSRLEENAPIGARADRLRAYRRLNAQHGIPSPFGPRQKPTRTRSLRPQRRLPMSAIRNLLPGPSPSPCPPTALAQDVTVLRIGLDGARERSRPAAR